MHATSSAYEIIFGIVMLSRVISVMLGSIEIFLISGSIPSINNMQLRASPCFTPFLILYLPALWLLS